MISGLKAQSPGGLDLKDQAENVLSRLMGQIIHVKNVVRATKNLFEVELATRDLANDIRQTFVMRRHYLSDLNHFNVKNKVSIAFHN